MSKSSKEEEKPKEKDYPLRVAFIHPDLGIGGAEQLMVNLALTCQKLGWYVKMYTPAYDPKRVFSQTKDGTFASGSSWKLFSSIIFWEISLFL